MFSAQTCYLDNDASLQRLRIGILYGIEEGGAKYVADGAPVKLVYMKEGVISKPDGIYIIKNAKPNTPQMSDTPNAKMFATIRPIHAFSDPSPR